jgi:hypothetical protein
MRTLLAGGAASVVMMASLVVLPLRVSGAVVAGPEVLSFGTNPVADPTTLQSQSPIVAMTTSGQDGYYLAAADGGVFAYGSARFQGSAAALPLAAPSVGIAHRPGPQGYWLAASDGGVFAFGTAQFLGSARNLPLQAPIVGIEATYDGAGYWLVAADGGVFACGTGRFEGSAAGFGLSKPVVGMTATPFGGYWLAAADGGVFSFGTRFWGSTANLPLQQPS